MTKELKKFNYTFDDGCLTAELLYADNSKKFIFIEVGSMIYVCDFDYDELSRRIAADDLDSFEAYDLTDGCSYYFASDYREDISDALLWLLANHIK